MSRKQIVAETREKYQQLPEVIQRKKEEERKREYATNRVKAQLYKKVRVGFVDTTFCDVLLAVTKLKPVMRSFPSV